MVARGPGAVGCAHCTLIGAETACEVCSHLVCPACAADWSTCPLPSGKVLRLGWTSRLFDVDPAGRLGLVSRMSPFLRCVDLRALSWVEVKLPLAQPHEIRPRLTAAGEVAHVEHDNASNGMVMFAGIAFRPLSGAAEWMVRRVERPLRLTAVTPRGDTFWYVAETETVTAIDLETREVTDYAPLPRKVLHAAYLDSAQRLVAAGSWGEVALCDIVDGKAVRRAEYPANGDVRWIAIAGPWMAVGDQTEVHVRRIGDTRGAALRLAGRHTHGALSRDARYFAAANARSEVVVHDLETGASQTFDEHTDDVSFLRFAGDDHLLITADDDNRVILRPRGKDGYARALKPAELRG